MKKSQQYVWEATWRVMVEEEEQPVSQLVAAKDFQAAFFKVRTWAKDNVPDGELISILKKEGMIV